MSVSIARDGAVPLFFQLKHWILDQIEKGGFKRGEKIPSEQDLMERFRVSRGTVRQALKELIDEGRVYLVRGRGTFVADPPRPKWSVDSLVSITELLKQQGLAFETRVLELSRRTAGGSMAAQLRIEPGDPILVLKRLRSVAQEPMLIATSTFPAELVEGLRDVDLSNRSLYDALEAHCGIRISRVDRMIRARLSEPSEAELLRLPVPSAVLVLEGAAHDTAGNLVEYSETVFTCDRNCFELQSKRLG